MPPFLRAAPPAQHHGTAQLQAVLCQLYLYSYCLRGKDEVKQPTPAAEGLSRAPSRGVEYKA